MPLVPRGIGTCHRAVCGAEQARMGHDHRSTMWPAVSRAHHMRGSMPAHATRGTDSAPSEEFSPHSCRFFLQAGLGGRYHPLLLSYFLEKTHPRLELGQSRLSRKIQLTDRTRRLLKKNQWYNIVHRQHSESVRQLPPATFAPVRRGVFRTG